MKVHTTNYFNTLIEVAEDTKAIKGNRPPAKSNKTIAEMQYEIISKNPYKYTSDDVLFRVFAHRNAIKKEDYATVRENFFSKGQACLRTSPLSKTYGFGIHSNEEGKVALYAVESKEYKNLLSDKNVKKVKAMRCRK